MLRQVSHFVPGHSKQFILTKLIPSTPHSSHLQSVIAFRCPGCSVLTVSRTEIMRAARILEAMESAHNSHKGAVGLSVNGRDEMIDAPMLRQVRVFVGHPRKL